MNQFVKKYESYCSIKRLQVERDPRALRRHLITKYGVIPHAQRTERVFGIGWVREQSAAFDAAAEVGSATSRPSATGASIFAPHFDYSRLAEEAVAEAKLGVGALARMQPVDLLVLFIDCGKFVRPSAADCVSYIDGPKGSAAVGFESAFLDFCETLGHDQIEPSLRNLNGPLKWGDHPLDDGFSTLHLQRKPVTIETLERIKPLNLNAGDRAQLGFRFYVGNFFIVVVHVLALCLLPVSLVAALSP